MKRIENWVAGLGLVILVVLVGVVVIAGFAAWQALR